MSIWPPADSPGGLPAEPDPRTRCQFATGFFVVRLCGRPVVGACRLCGTGVCEDHAQMTPEGPTCRICARDGSLAERAAHWRRGSADRMGDTGMMWYSGYDVHVVDDRDAWDHDDWDGDDDVGGGDHDLFDS